MKLKIKATILPFTPEDKYKLVLEHFKCNDNVTEYDVRQFLNSLSVDSPLSEKDVENILQKLSYNNKEGKSYEKTGD
jgi:hypothetical protein